MEEKETAVDRGRRDALKVIVVASAATCFASFLNILRGLGIPQIAFPEWPRVKVANIRDLKVGEPVQFNYPLEETPAIIVKLGKRVEGGVGPDGDIVAYNIICQHLGCIVRFYSGDHPENIYKGKNVLYCPCHGGWYDADNLGKVLSGPPLCELPTVKLEVDEAGDIYAVEMNPPAIFGKGPTPCHSDPRWDLVGGKLVSE